MRSTVPSIALCGAGMISHAHALAARQLNMPIIAVASRSHERAARRAAEVAARSVEYTALPSGADIVIVATPPAQHFDHVVHSLERGAAVVVEKPLVATLNEADRLVMIANRHANRVLYAENLAYAPAFRKWIKQVAEMGKIGHLSITMEQQAPTWGDFLQPQWGGGVLFDLGVHPVALAVLTARAAGAGEVVSVSARLEGDTTDEFAQVTLVFESELSAKVRVSWKGSDVPDWRMQAASADGALTLSLMPDVVLERNGEQLPLIEPSTQPAMIETLGYLDQLRAFSTDISSNHVPWMSAEFGRWILEIVCACYVSARNDSESTSVPSGCDRMLTPWELWRQ